MAKAKLVMASDVGGHREMEFPGQYGILFRAGDPTNDRLYRKLLADNATV